MSKISDAILRLRHFDGYDSRQQMRDDVNLLLALAKRAVDDELTAEAVRRSAEYSHLHENEPNEAKE